tara:strand:+ start:408 stop:2981 length:2574 start_codon:yes stop_codon:yes gene_type:complete
MMSISPVNNVSYYMDLAKEDYYSGHGEPKGSWFGIGARILGLHGQTIDDKDYQQLMTGFSPSGEPLVQNAGKDNRRAAWDCTLSAPKSVSIVWASASPQLKKKIEAAKSQAVHKTIRFMERQVATTRRGKNSLKHEKASGFVIAAFSHCTNRNENLPQPQLHYHVLILNVLPREDGTWGAVESNPIYRWKMATGAIYRAELAFQMQELGFEIEPDGDSFHIKGVSKNACDTYSSRAKEINKELKKAGIKSSSSTEGARIKTITRKAKKAVDKNVLFQKWKIELKKYGLTESFIDSLTLSEKITQPQELDQAIILSELTEKKAVFTKQDLFKEAAIRASHFGMSAIQAEEFSLQTLQNEEVISLNSENSFVQQFTTEDVITGERLMVKDAKFLANSYTKTMNEQQVNEAISLAEEQLSFSFDEEQKAAIQSTLCAGDLSITQGSAGAGKTTLMLAAKIACEQQGRRIQGACIAKKAANNLMQETGIQSHTVASLVYSINDNKHPLRNVDVLVVDEAGLLPSTDLQILLFEAKASNCKIILTGEDKQLDAINRGGVLRYLSRPEVLGAQRIETIRRQRQEWAKQVVADLRDGHSTRALRSLKEKKCLHWSESNDKAKEALIHDWHRYQRENPNKKSLVLAQQWKDVKVLSEAIRDIHIKEGRVGTENITLKCSVAEKLFEYKYSLGDRVKFCRNEYRSLRVSNGTLGTIKGIQQLENDVQFTIEVDDKRTISFLASSYSDELGAHLCHAYALTIYSSQGTTIDGNTFTLYSGSMNRANTYVALSRHKDESHLYINSAEMNERCRTKDISVEPTQEMREAQLAELTKRDNYHSLAIEHLTKKEAQQERESQQLHVAELEI